MSKRKPKNESTAPITPPTPLSQPKAPKRTGKALSIYLTPELRDQLDAMAEKTRRTVTAEVEIALEEYLAKHGMWPPSGASSAEAK